MARSVYQLPHDLPNNLRLRILGNQEIFEKSQLWVDTQSSSQSPFNKLDFGKSRQKASQNRYQSFLFLAIFTGFPYFVPNSLLGLWAELPSSQICWYKQTGAGLGYPGYVYSWSIISYQLLISQRWYVVHYLLLTPRIYRWSASLLFACCNSTFQIAVYWVQIIQTFKMTYVTYAHSPSLIAAHHRTTYSLQLTPLLLQFTASNGCGFWDTPSHLSIIDYHLLKMQPAVSFLQARECKFHLVGVPFTLQLTV